MKKSYLIIFLTSMIILPSGIKAQQANDFKAQHLKQTIADAETEAKIRAAFMRKKYNGDAAMEKSLYIMYMKQKADIANVIGKYSKSPELTAKLTAIIAKTDSISEVFLNAAKVKGLANHKVLRPDDISKFAAAVRLRKELGLNRSQIDTLMFHANLMPELRSTQIGFNPKEYERKILSKTLNDDQYSKLLVQEYRKKAADYAKGSWKELSERGIAKGLDSAKTQREIFNYNLGKWVVADRYGNEDRPDNSLKSLQTPEPEALKMLRTSKRYNNPVPDNKSNTNFTW
ncbi:MAG: hypothetical protein H7Y07_12225 [Pyrinomonadaceae bacterium]|nr:hypothetical protein [Sphingobacteriaceae bacterium]